MTIDFCSPLNVLPEVELTACQYHESKEGRCGASLTRLQLSETTRGHLCTTENFDDCPLFLSRIIRKQY